MFPLALILACQLSAADRAWIDSAVASWKTISRDGLRLPPAPMPPMILFDETCTSNGVEHGGTITLPDGDTMPARLTSFAGSYGPDEKPYFAMALRSYWQKRYPNDPNFERTMRAVFAHEMTHTRQMKVMNKRLKAISATSGLALPPDMDDDIIQKRFGGDPAFRAAYEVERDLFYAAVRETDPARRCILVREAAAAMKKRRETFFRGENAGYADVEDVFLSMEGAGNFSAWYAAKLEGNADPTTTVRGNGKWWSQEEGLAIFLVLDAMHPGWQQRVFADPPASILGLLEEAVH